MIKATFVSVWDGGKEIRTKCVYEPIARKIMNIEQFEDVHDLNDLEDEYIEIFGYRFELDTFVFDE